MSTSTDIKIEIDEQTKNTCLECNMVFQTQLGVAGHVGVKHKMKFQDYLVKHYMTGNKPRCPICQEHTRYVRGEYSFKKYCIKHANEGRAEWSKLNGYGVNGLESWKTGLTKETSVSVKKHSETLISRGITVVRKPKHKEYEFTSFLTEESLGHFLNAALPGKVTSQVPLEGRMSCDYSITGPNGILYVEFDGPYHYTSPASILNDERKRTIVGTIIRIPYFIQLDQQIWDSWFVSILNAIGITDTDILVKTNWAHGFISDKIVYPANYCSLGAKRFNDELEKFSSGLKRQILDSLENAAAKHKNRLLVFHE